MKSNRRKFLQLAALTGGATILPLSSCSENVGQKRNAYPMSDYVKLDEVRKEPEVSLELMYQDFIATKAKAIKLRAGRTEKLIRLARKKFGDDVMLMIDGNGSYSVKEAIRIGKILEEHNYYFYEEPVPWNWYEEQKLVEQALNIPMAGGEEEFSLHTFRYLR